jgi:hypothetical protein
LRQSKILRAAGAPAGLWHHAQPVAAFPGALPAMPKNPVIPFMGKLF